MRVTLLESVSVNGMMGRPDGRGDFFSDFCWTGFIAMAQQMKAMIWGRVTHDVFRAIPGALEQLSAVRGVVLSSRRDYQPGPGWQVASTPKEALEVLSRSGATDVLVAGGQRVNTAFLREGLLDEVVLFVESVIIARGMPLFAPTEADLRLELVEAKQESGQVLRLHYRASR